MITYLELEGKLGPKPQSQSNQFRPPFPHTNPQVRKESKRTEKRKRLIPTKKYKVKVVARPDPGSATMQPPQQNAPVNLESQQPPTSENNLEDAPVHVGTPWPEAGKMSGNLFEIRKDWPIPPTTNPTTITATNPKPPAIKVEPQDPGQANPNSTVRKPERCRLVPNWPIYKNTEEDWDREHQKQLQQSDAQQKYPSQGQDTRQAQVQNPQCTKSYQVPQSQHTQTSFNVPD